MNLSYISPLRLRRGPASQALKTEDPLKRSPNGKACSSLGASDFRRLRLSVASPEEPDPQCA